MLNKTMRSLPFRCFACIVSSLEIKHHMFETKTVRAASVSQFLEIPCKPASSHLHYSPLKNNLSESFHPQDSSGQNDSTQTYAVNVSPGPTTSFLGELKLIQHSTFDFWIISKGCLERGSKVTQESLTSHISLPKFPEPPHSPGVTLQDY